MSALLGSVSIVALWSVAIKGCDPDGWQIWTYLEHGEAFW